MLLNDNFVDKDKLCLAKPSSPVADHPTAVWNRADGI